MTPAERQLAPPGGWHPLPDAPLIAPLRLEQLGLPLRTLLWAAGKWGSKRTGSPQVPGIFLLLLRHPRLFWPWLRFASRLMPYGSLGRREAELVILRVGWNCRCRYEWGQHVQIGLREGLEIEQIARIAQGPQAPGWKPHEAALLQAADDLHRERYIRAETWRRLGEHYNSKQLLEVSLLVGHYEMLAGFLNSVGLALEPATEAQLAATAIHPAS